LAFRGGQLSWKVISFGGMGSWEGPVIRGVWPVSTELYRNKFWNFLNLGRFLKFPKNYLIGVTIWKVGLFYFGGKVLPLIKGFLNPSLLFSQAILENFLPKKTFWKGRVWFQFYLGVLFLKGFAF